MIDDGSQEGELLSTAAVRAMVECLLVNWRVEVLIEMLQRAILVVTQVTFVGSGLRVPSLGGCRVRGGALPGEKLLGNDPIRVASADSFVELLTIEGGVGTSALLEMVDEASRGGTCLLAERALET